MTSTLVTTVKQDVEQSKNGHQWLFSCYSPAKDCASLPGIDDISQEEMRYVSIIFTPWLLRVFTEKNPKKNPQNFFKYNFQKKKNPKKIQNWGV
jgi:hypothetical protein